MKQIKARMIKASVATLLLALCVNSQRLGAPSKHLDPEDATASAMIIGGSQAKNGKYPWFAASSNFSCGSSLVWKDILLTAAHCQKLFQNGAIIGAYGYKEGGIQVEVIETRRHPDFVESPFDGLNDVMVMKIDQAVYTRYVTINKNATVPSENETLTVLGMGVVSDEGNVPDALQEAQVSKTSDSDCELWWRKDPEIVMCAWGRDGTISTTCSGDSGGPLVDKSGNLVGLVSFGDSRSCQIRPTGYTRISSFADWIEAAICDMSEYPPKTCIRD
jgi:trypsin